MSKVHICDICHKLIDEQEEYDYYNMPHRIKYESGMKIKFKDKNSHTIRWELCNECTHKFITIAQKIQDENYKVDI